MNDEARAEAKLDRRNRNDRHSRGIGISQESEIARGMGKGMAAGEPHYARICGATPGTGPIAATTWFPRRLLQECFGPAERYGSIVFWCFSDAAEKRYALIAEDNDSRDVEVKFQAPVGGAAAFYAWASEKLAATENGDLKPAFVSDRVQVIEAVRA